MEIEIGRPGAESQQNMHGKFMAASIRKYEGAVVPHQHGIKLCAANHEAQFPKNKIRINPKYSGKCLLALCDTLK